MPSIESLGNLVDPKQERCKICDHQHGVHSEVSLGTTGDERKCLGEGEPDGCSCSGFVGSGRYAP